MKKLLLVLLIAFCSFTTIAQKITISPQILQVAWAFSSSFFIDEIKDPLAREIIDKTVPKLINQDYKGASYEICDAIYRVKKIKVLNKEYLFKLEKDIRTGVNSVQKKDFVAVVNTLLNVTAYTYDYIKTGVLQAEETITEIYYNEVPLKADKSVEEKLYISRFNDYVFYLPNSTYELLNLEKNNYSFSNFEDHFEIDLPDSTYFFFGVEKATDSIIGSSEITVEKLLSYPDGLKIWNDAMPEILEDEFGKGSIIDQGNLELQSFSALKYTYAYIYTYDTGEKEATLTDVYIAFSGSSYYMIYFDSPAADYDYNKSLFSDVMQSFFLLEENLRD